MSFILTPSNGTAPDPDKLRRTRIWDLPTRLFHWLLAPSVVALIVTAKTGAMEWHFRFGYLALALLVFRLVWGFVGGRWSRFAHFFYAPRTVLAYLRGQAHPEHLVGHTPLGALSVFALLAVLALQVASGLAADDEISASGPLARFVSGDIVSLATSWHATPGQWIVIALAGLHVLAVLLYALFKRDPLVRPMISGDKRTALPTMPSRDDAASRALAVLVFALCAALAYGVASLRL